jgi:hypothetical protein
MTFQESHLTESLVLKNNKFLRGFELSIDNCMDLIRLEVLVRNRAKQSNIYKIGIIPLTN